LFSLQGILLLTIALVFYLAYSATIAELEYYWVEGYNWQFLIPIAFVYMLWERRELFSRLEYRPSAAIGGILLILSCIVLIAGQVSTTQALREISIVASMFALTALLLGVGPTRRLFWPLAYLILMTSLPTMGLEMLREPLKLLSATIAAEFLQTLGYAIYREGAFLHLPHITLEVADSCSGVNQLTSSIALGIPIAFTILNKWWKRIFIILVSVAFGIMMNWVRVILISLWHYETAKPNAIHGPENIYGLPFIFMVGVFLTLLLAFAIAEKRSPSATTEAPVNDKPNPLSRLFGSRGFIGSALVAIAILGAAALYLYTWKAQPVEPIAPLTEFPMAVAGFEGQPIEKLEKPFYSGLADDELIAGYQNSTGETATVYIGYFRLQNQQKELVDYRYNWLHEGAQATTIEVAGKPLQVKRTTIRQGGLKKTVFFSYDINGRDIVDLKQAKLASLIDALLRQRNNGGIVMVIFDGQEQQLSPASQRFLEAVLDRAWEMLP